MWKRLLLFYLRQIQGLVTPGRIISFGLQNYRNRTFLIEPDKGITLTFGEFAVRVKKVLEVFAKSRLKAGDILAFSGKNSADLFKVRAACHLTGVVFFGLPAHLSKETTEYFIRLSGAKRVLCLDQACLDAAPPLKEAPPESQKANGKIAPGVATFNLSSGTTQPVPKIVQLTNRNWVESLYGYLRAADLKSKKKIVFMCTAPYLTAGSTTFLPSFLAGVTHIIVDETAPAAELFKHIKERKVTRLYITPSRLIELMEWLRHHHEQITTLEYIITGTERFPPAKLKASVEFFGPIITVGYGMAEVLPPLAILTPKDYPRFDTVGRICEGVDIKFLDNGRIALRSSTASPGYYAGDPTSTSAFQKGWFYTNDFGFLDREGYLHIRGRQEELLRTQPEPVFASEVEDAVYELLFIDRCAALTKNNEIFVFVSFRHQTETADADEAIQILKAIDRTPLKGMPARIIVKESLPINALGKLDRTKLFDEITW